MHCGLITCQIFSVFVYGIALQHGANILGASASLRSSIHKANEDVQQVVDVNQVTFPPMAARRFFFTHHKTGTRLASGIGQDIGNVLNEKFLEVGIEGKSWHCLAHSQDVVPGNNHGVVEFANMNIRTFDNMKAECPDFKAVHFVREAGALVVSGYLYHLYSNDTIPGTGPEILAGKGLKEGLLVEAKAEVQNTLQEMLDLHNQVKDDPRVLTVGLEETQRDFDGTMRKILAFMLGDTDAQDATNHLVGKAHQYDIARWSEQEREQSDHIADPATTRATIQALEEMRSKGNPVVKQVFSFDAPLGYKQPNQAELMASLSTYAVFMAE